MIGLTNRNYDVSIIKKLNVDVNALEIDILCRLNHPNILHKNKIYNNYIELPISDRTLTSFINDKNILINEKIYIIYKLYSALIYFHKHNILLSAINEKCIVLNRNNHKYYEPLFIDFIEAKIIDDDDFSLDIYAFGLLSLQILLGRNIKEEILEMTNHQSEYKNILISSLPTLLEFIPYQHYNNCIDFFQNLFCINTCNTNDIYHHSLFK